MTLAELVKLLRKYIVLVIALPVLCTVLAVIVCYGFMANSYTAKTTLYVLSEEQQGQSLQTSLSTGLMISNDIAEIAKSSRVRTDAARSLGLTSLSGYSVTVASSSSSRVVTLSVTGPNPELAASIANAIADDLSSVAREAMNVEAVNVIEPAETPSSPSGPNRPMYILVALLAGLLASIAIVVVADMLNVTCRSGEEVTKMTGLSVLGRIPAVGGARASRRSKKKSHGSSVATNTPEVANAVKTLAANIGFASIDEPVKTIVVTSSVPDEGKSTLSVALAEAVAESGKNVLLMECDLRKRSLAHRLQCHPAKGLLSVLSKQCEPMDAITPLPLPSGKTMYFLDSEAGIMSPADVLGSKRFAGFLQKAGQNYDLVIVDMPPTTTFVDSSVVASIADATILVVREGYVRRDEVQASVDQLQKADANIIGVVMNFVSDNDKSSYYYYYYSSDKSGKSGKSSKSGSSGSSRQVSGRAGSRSGSHSR